MLEEMEVMLEEMEVMLEEMEVMLEEMEVMLEEMEEEIEVMLEEMEVMLVVKVFVGAYWVVGKRLRSDQVRQLVLGQSPDEDIRCSAYLQEQTPLFWCRGTPASL